jgi:predicted DNA-binding antitoxin AbrB/MazE fold protein
LIRKKGVLKKLKKITFREISEISQKNTDNWKYYAFLSLKKHKKQENLILDQKISLIFRFLTKIAIIKLPFTSP